MNLSNIPTPLTDAAVAKSGFMGEEKVTADFARRLERERHVLREALQEASRLIPHGHPRALIVSGKIGQALTLTAPTESSASESQLLIHHNL